jgi:hypothetical protein
VRKSVAVGAELALTTVTSRCSPAPENHIDGHGLGPLAIRAPNFLGSCIYVNPGKDVGGEHDLHDTDTVGRDVVGIDCDWHLAIDVPQRSVSAGRDEGHGQ